MKITLIKLPQGLLAPAGNADRETLEQRWRVGETLSCTATKPRNPGFHRKFFAMLDLGYDSWEPEQVEYNGMPAQKNRERFRKDCLIAAGFYDPVINLKGDVRAEALSMAFGAMDDKAFEEVYSAVADVLLQKVLTMYTRDDLDEVVDNLLGFV